MTINTDEKAPFEIIIVPHYKTIDDLRSFCNKHEELFIYGICPVSSSILEYLRIIKSNVKAYVVSDDRIHHYSELTKDGLPILAVSQVSHCTNAGFIIGLPDFYYNDAINNLKQNGLLNFFLIREYDKRGFVDRLQKRTLDTFIIGVQLVNHCNLGCQMCSNFSQLSEEDYLDFEVFSRDMHRMRELTGDGFKGYIYLAGGEPLLHPQVNDFIALAAEIFPDAFICLITNGINLKKIGDTFWKTMHKSSATLAITLYPINLDMDAILERANQFSVRVHAVTFIEDPKSTSTDKSHKFPLDLSGSQTCGNFIYCGLFNASCIVLKEGKLSTCSLIPNIHIFNEYFGESLKVCKDDCIDIYEAQSFDELASFVKKPPPFCKYCDVINRRRVGGWARSIKTIDEYIDSVALTE
jgi:hypothetical protein